MDRTTAGLIVALFAFLGTMWWQVNSRIDMVNSRMDTVNSRMDTVQQLLTDNLIALNRDIGELQGASHIHAK